MEEGGAGQAVVRGKGGEAALKGPEILFMGGIRAEDTAANDAVVDRAIGIATSTDDAGPTAGYLGPIQSQPIGIVSFATTDAESVFARAGEGAAGGL